jgi:chemotaxis protein methyltransferase CheR
MKNLEFNTIQNNSWIEISPAEFENIANFVYNNIGINLTDQKMTLLMGRLQKILKKYTLSSFSQYYQLLINDKSGAYLSEFANVISTNHTFFYRESDHFEYFKSNTLPELDEKLRINQANDIRIWSAGCSSGEEPYFLVMLMKEYFGNRYSSLDAGILATDISTKVLQIATNGIYGSDRLNVLPEFYKKKYFSKLPDNNFEVTNEIKKEVTYRRFNLMNDTFPFKKQFDVIFCRNVMIYFDTPTRDTLVQKFYNHLAPGGLLFIGHSETLNKRDSNFKYIMPAVYRK